MTSNKQRAGTNENATATSRTNAILSLTIILAFAFGPTRQASATEPSLRELCNHAVLDVGHARIVQEAPDASPLLIIEEIHNSRQVQIEQAIMLVRLHAKGLRDIALEGYLMDADPQDTQWYQTAASKNPRGKITTAIRLLEEGEISAAEFAALALDGIRLVPIEIEKEYSSDNIDRNASGAVEWYLLKIAEHSVRSENPHKGALTEAIAAFKELEARKANVEEIDTQRRVVADTLATYKAWAISQDDWAKNRYEEVQRITSGEWKLIRFVEIADEVQVRVKNLNISVGQEAEAAMKAFMVFWAPRANATKTMADATAAMPGAGSSPQVAVIGAAHTGDMVELLKTRRPTLAVLTPAGFAASQKKEALELYPASRLNRKYERESLYPEGLSQWIVEHVPSQKKPQPVLNEPWLRAKSELYLFTDRVAREILGPGGSTRRGQARWGFGGGELTGKYITVDPDRISLASAAGDEVFELTGESLERLRQDGVPPTTIASLTSLRDQEVVGQERFLSRVRTEIGDAATNQYRNLLVKHGRKGNAVLFPAASVQNGEILWVKAKLGSEFSIGSERVDVEEMLRKSLERVRDARSLPTRVEDSAGRVQITIDTFAAFGSTSEAVANVALTAI